MRALKSFLALTILSLPALVFAEPIKLECSIVLNDFVDEYSIEVDLDKKLINTIYHAASNKDHSITIDYKISSPANISDDKIIYKAKLNSIDYIFSINRQTYSIIRYINDPNDDEAGRGSCNIKEARGRKL